MKVRVDSELSAEEAVGHNAPADILHNQEVLKVEYHGFDRLRHIGQIIMHQAVIDDVKDWFDLAWDLQFPINKVAPASMYNGDDDWLMAANVSSGFNYRKIAGSSQLSCHARGLAFDINPLQNPYIRKVGEQIIVAPPDAYWDTDQPGTLYEGHKLVQFMIDKGWEWGGDWSLSSSGRIDYQHFQKALD